MQKGSVSRASLRGRSALPRPTNMTFSLMTTTPETSSASPPGPTVSCSGGVSTQRTGINPTGPLVTLFDFYMSSCPALQISYYYLIFSSLIQIVVFWGIIISCLHVFRLLNNLYGPVLIMDFFCIKLYFHTVSFLQFPQFSMVVSFPI